MILHQPLHLAWLNLVLVNVAIQVLYFFHDTDSRLLAAKKITTPLLLFFGLFISLWETGTFPVVTGSVLLAMGLGELGIEGSSVVQQGDEGTDKTSPVVIVAGVVFLLVNVFLGAVLITKNFSLINVTSSLAIALLLMTLFLLLIFKRFKPAKDIKTQILLYSLGLVVLYTGGLTDVMGGISLLGVAALLLSLSDTLVLIRMGSHYTKETRSGFAILLAYLVSILFIYYVYMGVLIHISSPFRF
jgi:hypothetical protein